VATLGAGAVMEGLKEKYPGMVVVVGLCRLNHVDP
jgi:hypothetical protein